MTDSIQTTNGDAMTILENADEAYLRLDAAFRFTFINRAAEALLGAPRSQMIGRTPWEVRPDTAGTPLEEGFRRAKAENAKVTFDNYYDPWKRWYTITATPDSNGGLVVHFLDSTERKRTQLALRESEERYRVLFEHMQEGVAYCRMIFEDGEPKDYIYLMVNRAFEGLNHLGDVVGRRATEVIPGFRESDPELFQIYGRVAQTGEPQKVEMYVKALEQWFSISAYSPQREHFVTVFEIITGRRQAESKLAEQSLRFRRTIEETDAGYFRIGADGRFEDVNRAWLRMYGFSEKSEIVGQPFAVVQVPDDLARAAQITDALLRGESAIGGEFSRLRRDGTVGYHTFSANPLVAGGQVVGIEGFLIDITDRKKAEQERQESDRRYRTLFDSMHEGVAVHRLIFSGGVPETYMLLDVNHRYEEIIGIKREDVINRLATEVYGVPAPPYLKEFASAVEAGSPIDFETHFEPMDKHFVISVAPMGDNLFATIFFDVTEQRKTEKAMRSLVTAIEQTGETIVVTDLDGIIQYCNPAFERVTGYTKEEAIGQSTRLLKSGKHNREFYERMWATLTRGDTWKGHLINRKKDGSLYEEDATISPIRERSGDLCGFVAVKRDVTERLHLEQQLVQAQKLESIGRLAGGVAHDFNNLLTVINGYCGLVIRKLNPGDPVWRDVNEIMKAGERAASLTKQLLAFSRKQVVEPKPLNLNVCIRDAEQMLQRLAGEDIVLSATLEPSLGQVLADPDQIHQVLMNVVANARDAMPHGGRLDIVTANADIEATDFAPSDEAKAGRYVVMSVSDTGTGMDENTRQHVFEPFFTTKEHGKGTGLGLSTVYGIVRQNGGWIDVSSEPGAGTSFKLYFPRAEACGSEETDGRARAAAGHGGETILVVEDQDALRRLTVTILKSKGYRVLEAPDGDAAWEVARRYPGEIQMVLTDVVLPGINGRELSERLKQVRPGLKVLYTSGYTSDVIGHRGVLDTGLAYLPKPFSPEKLEAKVREVLNEPGHRS